MTVSLDDFGVYFHGTREESAKMIRKKGFDIRSKQDGATSKLLKATGAHDENAKRYHYVTKSFKEAAEYAKCFKRPKIVRVMVAKSWLQGDEQAGSGTAFKTKKAIDPIFVLPSSKKKLNESTIAFLGKEIFKRKLTPAEASALKEKLEKAYIDDENTQITQATSAVDKVKKVERGILQRVENSKLAASLKPGESVVMNLEELKRLGFSIDGDLI